MKNKRRDGLVEESPKEADTLMHAGLSLQDKDPGGGMEPAANNAGVEQDC